MGHVLIFLDKMGKQINNKRCSTCRFQVPLNTLTKSNAKLWKDDSCKAMQSRFIVLPASFESYQLRCNYRFQNYDMPPLNGSALYICRVYMYMVFASSE